MHTEHRRNQAEARRRTGQCTQPADSSGGPMMRNRPTVVPGGSLVVDRDSATVIRLLGGRYIEQVAITTDQEAALYRLYGYDPALDTNELAVEGRFRNMTRNARNDGMRIVAFLARFCAPGEDPLRVVRSTMIAAGYDVMLEEDDEGSW